MAKNTGTERSNPKTPRSSPFFLAILVALVWLTPNSGGLAAEHLLDQTVAVVGKYTLTLHDLEADYVLSEILDHRRIPAPDEFRRDSKKIETTRNAVIRKTVIQLYLEGTGLAATVSATRVSELKSKLTNVFKSSEQASTFLRSMGISSETQESFLQQRIRTDIFMERLVPTRYSITDKDVTAYYEREKDRRFLGKPLESIRNVVEEDLRREMLRNEFARWLEAETRRIEIIRLPLVPSPG